MRRAVTLGRILVVSLSLMYLVGCFRMPPMSEGVVHKEVQIFFNEIPDRPYEVIAYESAGATWTNELGEAVGNLCKKAKKLGGDALIRVKYKTPLFGPVKASGTVIRWKQEEWRQEEPVSEEPKGE